MRISSGKLKGRTFYPPANHWPTRPTTDVSREALFNILTNLLDFENTKVLDLFGGTGAHSYEFISRGCEKVDYVDSFRQACAFVKKMSEQWKIQNNISIHCMDYAIFLRQNTKQFDYIFAGPPYPLPEIPQIPDLIFTCNVLAEDGLFVLEHNPQHDFNKHPQFKQERKYGQTIFSFFQH